MSQKFAKRFYKVVSLGESANAQSKAEGFHILLDGRVLKTPKKQDLIIKKRARAQIVADEWDAQETEINPSLMPATRLMNVACEQTPTRRDELIAQARNYAGTDLLCYRAGNPSDLTARQHAQWGPLLHWAADLGVVLESVTGIIAITQAEDSLDIMANLARVHDDVDLTLLVHFTAVFGSAVLGLAVMKKYISASRAFDLSRLDEAYQIEQWGEDDEAKARTEIIHRETLALAELIE